MAYYDWQGKQQARKHSPAKPPTTPPTMAPMGTEDEDVEVLGAGDGGAGDPGTGDTGCTTAGGEGEAAVAALGEMPHVCAAPAEIV